MSIYVWGTGCGASELIEQGLSLQDIAGFVDSFPSGETFLGKPVLLPEQLDKAKCQLLIVTTRHTMAVARRCRELEIDEKRILFLKNNVSLTDRNGDYAAAKQILGEELLKNLMPQQHIVPNPAQLADTTLPQQDVSNDYVRLATLELLCRRLTHTPGAAAELGVYKGFFARCINLLLPERRLYLFDSFEGFSPSACASESFQAAHENTSVSRVLEIMPHRDRITVKPGFFPGSAEGLEEQFCLVSLDVDFYETTLEGLRYFWPRLNPGGYLLLHDWGSPKLPGVKQALADYEWELGCTLPAVPLCDLGGSLIICK